MIANSVKKHILLVKLHQYQTYLSREKDKIFHTPIINVGSLNGQSLIVYCENLKELYHYQAKIKFNSYQISTHFESAIITFIILKKKYGCFKITQEMINLNFKNELRVWMNRDPVSNYPEFPLKQDGSSQYLMVSNMIKIFKPLVTDIDQYIKCFTLQNLLSKLTSRKESKRNFHKLDEKLSSYKSIHCLIKQPKCKKMQFQQFLNLSNAEIDQSINLNESKHIIYKDKKIPLYRPPLYKSPKISMPRNAHKMKINFTYESIQNYKNHKVTSMQCSEIFSVNDNFSSYNLKTNSKISLIKYSSIQSFEEIQETDRDQEFYQVQAGLEKEKFPTSTKSTFITLKENRSNKQLLIDEKAQIQQNFLINESKVSTNNEKMSIESNQLNNLSAQFDKLFEDDIEQIDKQLQSSQLQREFQQILFD